MERTLNASTSSAEATLVAVRKANRLANGYERRKGSIWHAAPRGGGAALCGAEPAVAWTPYDAEPASTSNVTCRRCRTLLPTKARPN